MDRNEEIAASVRRLTKLKAEALAREANSVVLKSSKAGILSGSAHVQAVERVCLAGFREMSTAAAVLLAEIDGEDAPRHADRLGEALREAQASVLDIFGKFAAPGQSPANVKNFAGTRRQSLEQAINETIEGTVADLRLGIAGGMNVKKQQTGVSIDNRGGSGQFSVNSPGASQAIGGDQITTTDIDAAALTVLLKQVREEVAKAPISIEARESIEDAVVSAERELQAPSPNPGRVRRLLGKVGTAAQDFGVNVAAALVTAKLQSMGM